MKGVPVAANVWIVFGDTPRLEFNGGGLPWLLVPGRSSDEPRRSTWWTTRRRWK